MSRNRPSIVETGNPLTFTGGVGPVFRVLDAEGFSISVNVVSGTVNGSFSFLVTDFDGVRNDQPSPNAGDWWAPAPAIAFPSTAAAITTAVGVQVYPSLTKWWQLQFTDHGSSTPIVKWQVTFHAWQPIG